MKRAFGADVDYAQIIKTYVTDQSISPERQYSAPDVITIEKRPIVGDPDMALASTSYIERLNATTRLHMRRLTRLTLAFSKKLENFEAAVGLHFAYYNFVKRHITLRATPAMACGVTSTQWNVARLASRGCASVTYIEELRDVIRRLHGVESRHVGSVPIKETFRGKTVWDGCVEVFELVGRPTATKLYAWSHATDNPDNPNRHVTILHSDLITSPLLAVRAAIIQEFKANASAEA